ncbi:hypothetical protein LINGRAHAP2_LOCUS30034 [Linum grandiflorum]
MISIERGPFGPLFPWPNHNPNTIRLSSSSAVHRRLSLSLLHRFFDLASSDRSPASIAATFSSSIDSRCGHHFTARQFFLQKRRYNERDFVLSFLSGYFGSSSADDDDVHLCHSPW